MTQANQEIDYFHINRTISYSPHQLLNVGDSVDIGWESNPYFRQFEKNGKTYTITTNEGQSLQIPGVKFIGGVKRGEINSPNLAAIAYELSRHLAGLVGELIWEDVRRNEFPHLPSRQRCIWLIPDIAGVRYWISRLEIPPGTYQVLRVRCQGRIHIASEKHLLGDSVSLDEATRKARQYWLGVIPEPNTEEIIFEGRFTIHEVVHLEQYA